jgi:superfamily I DNA/RNA helicase
MTTHDDAAEAARQLLLSGKVARPWVAAVVDETQDLSAAKLRFLRALVPEGRNDLFLAGDAHQRIYGRAAPLSRVGIDIRGRGARLTLNYRTTKEIAAFAMSVLKGTTADDLDEATADLRGFRSIRRGPAARLRTFAAEEDEASAIRDEVKSLAAAGVALDEVCIVGRTAKALESAQASLTKAGIPTVSLGDRTPSAGASGVRLATMHRVKGLEFRAVLVPGLRDTAFPLRAARMLEEPESDWHARERRLLFVACTRARDRLLLTASGPISPLLVGQ